MAVENGHTDILVFLINSVDGITFSVDKELLFKGLYSENISIIKILWFYMYPFIKKESEFLLKIID